MKRLKLLSLAVAGVVLPVALVFSAYMVARGAIGEAGAVPPVPQNRVVDESSPSPRPTEDNSGRSGSDDRRDGDDDESESEDSESDNSGPGGGSDNSGKGSDDDPRDDSSNSGPGGGSDNSGKGSGDD
jgi:hypothetical protein